MSEKKVKDAKMEIQLDEETAQGVYSNLAVVNHTDAEFTLDFIFVQPQAPRAKVRSRVITSPKHIKRLILALEDNLRKYEQSFGQVSLAAPRLDSELEKIH
ncbi:hypothetical protein DESUT3_30080 [Desulfuromonas versatilis]|uniref:DUF3467 domain-containing protein n=1 Tax=Desulfuromonas versatilis TaxID=2802975 RepID=A0ABM8HVB9_9BACT|nr:DUF3467 domain-containing protein [Desulfuromonas versatilis]BCR05939.1 hypothetical protein DESUT3_30080 [Desulfuromonas versatilis]